jgi:hypothetical protein
MSAKVKCSNCGTEISNLNFGWGKKQMILPFLFSIPILLIGFFPLVKMLYFKGDFRKELTVTSFEKREQNGSIEIVGEIANNGTHNWQSLSVEAEFYDNDGKFLDEYQSYMQGSIAAGTKEHFKILVTGNSPEIKKADVNVKVKISTARNYDN